MVWERVGPGAGRPPSVRVVAETAPQRPVGVVGLVGDLREGIDQCGEVLLAVTPPPPVLDRGGGGGGQEGARGLGGRTQQPPQWDEDLTLGEFIVENGAKTFQQKICAAGYYLINFRHAESFNRDDVRTALADAHEDMPGNFGRDFGSAASSHLIAAKQGEAGQFIIPRTGRTAVESHFQDVPKRRTARRATKKTSSNSNGDAE